MKSFTAGSNEDGVRLSRFVQNVTTNFPNSLLYKSFRNKRIKVNGKKAVPEYRLTAGDVIELYINDEFFIPTQTVNKPLPLPRHQPTVDVIYEDERIAVLYKPAHLLCHSDRTGDANLVDAFTSYLIQKGEYQPQQEHHFSPALCNRLDRGTEGLVLAAKDYQALRDLNSIIREDLLQKEYLTITFGIPPQGKHIAYLRHEEKNNKVTVRSTPLEGFKQIITQVDILEKSGPFALCRIGLITGRTHQIRAHLSFLGAPVLGDIKYGNRKINQRTDTKTQALCAARLTFCQLPEENTLHYLSGKNIQLEHPAILEQFSHLKQH